LKHVNGKTNLTKISQKKLQIGHKIAIQILHETKNHSWELILASFSYSAYFKPTHRFCRFKMTHFCPRQLFSPVNRRKWIVGNKSVPSLAKDQYSPIFPASSSYPPPPCGEAAPRPPPPRGLSARACSQTPSATHLVLSLPSLRRAPPAPHPLPLPLRPPSLKRRPPQPLSLR
jgi:hypothetical protein